MADITLSNGIRNNLLSLQSTADLLDRTQFRLSTGRKVNTALDDPLNYFQADTLASRGRALSSLLDSLGLGIKTLETTDAALTNTRRLLEQAQGVIAAARQSPTRVAGFASGYNTVTKSAIDYTTNPSLIQATGGPFDAGDQFTITGTDDNGAAFAAITVNVGTPTNLLAVPPVVATAQDLVTAINDHPNNPPSASGTPLPGIIQAKIDEAGRLVINNIVGTTTTANTGNLRIVLTDGGATTNTLVDLFGAQERPYATTANLDTGVITPTLNQTRRASSDQYNELLNQITNLAKDAGYNGTNLLYGQSLTVFFNEETTTNLIVRGVVFDAAGLGLRPTDANYDFQSDFEIDSALDKIKQAVRDVQAQQATFASSANIVQTRQSFTKEVVKNLEIGADDLVVADLNEEGANILALQTRQQLSVQALSLTAQADQAILRLFG